MSKTVYIETSIPSFFFEARFEPEMVARGGLYVPTLVTPLELLEDEDDAT